MSGLGAGQDSFYEYLLKVSKLPLIIGKIFLKEFEWFSMHLNFIFPTVHVFTETFELYVIPK